MGELIVVAVRLIVPLSIFRSPLWGGLASMLVDMIDVLLIEVIGQGAFSNYPALDKALDTYYLSFELIVSLRWEALARWTSVVLFIDRAIGVIAFEITQARVFLLIFPNLFENFYIFYLVVRRYFPHYDLTPQRLMMWLAVLLAPKLAQEYMLHYLEVKPWDWTKHHILRNTWPF